MKVIVFAIRMWEILWNSCDGEVSNDTCLTLHSKDRITVAYNLILFCHNMGQKPATGTPCTLLDHELQHWQANQQCRIHSSSIQNFPLGLGRFNQT